MCERNQGSHAFVSPFQNLHTRKARFGNIVIKTQPIFTYFLAFLDVEKLYSKTRKGMIEKILLGSNRAYMS